MSIKEIKKIEQSDIENLKMLNAVLLSGSFDLKGNAVERVAFLFLWAKQLEEKMRGELKLRALSKAKKPVIKKVDK